MRSFDINPQEVKGKLVKFIRDQCYDAGFKRGILGLSGGIDSAVIAYLASIALGPENVFGIIMPYETTSEDSMVHARIIVKNLGINSQIIDISPMVNSYFQKFPDVTPSRKGNKMARERMSILFDLSARYEALVIGSSNKSEILLGYGTIFGDTASAMMPLGNLYKTNVRVLAKYLAIPDEIIKKAPSAELWPGQTDEGELGFTYDEADKFLFNMIDLGKSNNELEKMGFKEEFIKKISDRIKKMEYKRRLPATPKDE